MSDKYEDEDFNLAVLGPHYIDPKYLQIGFCYGLVGNLPGQIEYYQRLGYEVVKDEDIDIGQDKPNKSSSFGSAVTVQSKCGQTMVLMRIPTDLKKKIDARVTARIKEKNASLGHVDGIPLSSQYGEIQFLNNK